jgi:renalase
MWGVIDRILNRVPGWARLSDMSPTEPNPSTAQPVIVIGAGLTGLVAATQLAREGVPTLVLDKGRSVGGRLATRRAPGSDGHEALFDHGAQFFTVRSAEFSRLVDGWLSIGLVREWCRGFRPGGDGFPRYVADGGMNAIAKHLAQTVDVRCNTKVHAIGGDAGTLSVSADDGQRWESDVVVATPPVPQSLALCENGWLPIPEDDEQSLLAISYAPCLALLVSLDRPSYIPAPGGLQLEPSDDAVFSFVGDNAAKGISKVSALTLHVNDRVSMERYDEDDDDTRAYLLSEASRFFDPAGVVHVELKKWRFARPIVGYHARLLNVESIPGTSLIFGGDAFGDSKVEGAVLSGLAIADYVASRNRA